MIGDKWANLLEELGKVLKTSLKPDKLNCCLLKFKTGTQVQMELDSRGENIHIAASLGELPQGRYRENVMKEALKANGLPPPQKGIFAYGKKTESLLLFDELSLNELSGDKLADYLSGFVQKADLWRETITRGEVPSFMGTEATFTGKAGGLFGLIH